MKGLIIQRVVVSSILILLSSCHTVNVILENGKLKKALPNNDYIIEFHKNKTLLGNGTLVIEVFDKEKQHMYNYGVFINNLCFTELNKERTLLKCTPNKSYDIKIVNANHKSLRINNLIVKDSTIIKAYLEEAFHQLE